MAEMFGRVGGYCKGKGGSMHIADIKLGNLGANGIVGAGIPIATGAALGIKYMGTNQVVMCFLGEGGALEGEFHESLNFAGLHKLPIIYVIENNQYSLSTSIKRASAVEDLSSRASAYNMPGKRVDGMNVEAVFDAATEAINHVRKGDGPYLLECLTYRYYGHSRSDAAPYRTKEEEKAWKKQDPIVNYQGLLAERGTLPSDECEKMQKKIDLSLDDAVAFADSSVFPSVNEIFADIYAD